MADVQPQHGATLIANELIREVFIKGYLSKAQMQIVFAIIDESWAWIDKRRSTREKKVKHKVSRRPLRPKDIADKTGIHISDVCKQLNSLIAAKVIRRHWDYYQFNKNYDRWILDELQTKKTREKTKSTREKTQQTRENSRKVEESRVGKFPNGTREIPQQQWGISPLRWPAILRAARGAESLNKDINKELNKVWGLYKDHPDYLEPTKPKDLRYSKEHIETIIEYWKVLKFTRKSGKIAESVIEREMDYWERFDIDVTIAGLETHMHRYKTSKKEDYTRGIMRRLQTEKEQGVNIHGRQGTNQHGRRNGQTSSQNSQQRVSDEFFEQFERR